MTGSFEERQRGAMFDLRRSSFSQHEPPGFNRASRRLDQIEQAQAEALRIERARETCSRMNELMDFARGGEIGPMHDK